MRLGFLLLWGDVMKLELYVPDEPAFPARLLKAGMIDKFGGLTATAATGSWKSLIDGATITEPIEICTVYADQVDVKELEQFLGMYKVAAAQEAVMYVMDGKQVLL